ncbi:hemerythrin domain-containing protein [Yinghuangia soli]|uniref:Hemerythrin domain-containing protein n=1 Tax=Yinghuangia soli TaxID=2908204 RepID=A0AA41PY04_9ACTN|nr:hemerythrin domain-containing protein [Yinghuangia soli]MCF2527963.1 hemerythrin domain-containing protein [Yinghuangia soli]
MTAAAKTFRNDMTMMFAIHDALRRELEQILRITERADDDPRHILHAAAGWELFKHYLHIHHGAEDDVLWPAVTEALADRPDDLAVIEAMEAEHAAVDPGIAFFDAAIADPSTRPEKLAAIADRLHSGLGGHLRHEEDEALAIIDDVATPGLLARFGAEHTARLGAETPTFLPWLLDGATDSSRTAVLGQLPPPVRDLYTATWAPAYARRAIWTP